MFRKRHLLGIIIGVALMSASWSPAAFGQEFGDDETAAAVNDTLGLAGHSWNRREMKIELVLGQEARFDYFETRLGDVIAELQNDYQIPIMLDASVQDAGVDADELITLSLSDVSLRSGLNIMLRPIHCTFVVKDEVLFIMSVDAENEHLVLRIYDCGDLLERLGGNSEARLLDVIHATVNTESWDVHGGRGGVAEIGGRLVVNQNSDGHRKLAWLLKTLNREFADP
ncbi:MAG: hypothetical protein ACR2NP_02660 [Pirellulaceae bacterium]